jgi:hypothetical protein
MTSLLTLLMLSQTVVSAPTAAAPPPPPPSAAARAEAAPDFDRVRLRSGLALNGGWTFGPVQGPIAAASLRLGIQFGRVFGLYVQSMPQLFVVLGDMGAAAGFALNNSLLMGFTLFDFLELATGPSADFVAAAGLKRAGASSDAVWGLGIHGRVGLHLGQRNPNGGNRSGLSIALDVHPIFAGTAILFMTTLGVGIDWY